MHCEGDFILTIWEISGFCLLRQLKPHDFRVTVLSKLWAGETFEEIRSFFFCYGNKSMLAEKFRSTCHQIDSLTTQFQHFLDAAVQ